MRLIDADALIERKFVLHDIEDMTNEEFENLVNTQPTAYDIKSVVTKLDEKTKWVPFEDGDGSEGIEKVVSYIDARCIVNNIDN